MISSKKKVLIWLFCIITPILLFTISLFIGRYGLSFSEVVAILFEQNSLSTQTQAIKEAVIYEIRLPRAILAFIVGATLAISGAAQQGVFRNPLVDSGMLGVSAGAGFGACLAIVLFGESVMIYIFSFCFGVLAMFLSYLVGRIYDTTPTITLVLGGVIVSSIFAALISFIKYIADPLEKLPTITFWLMGSLAKANYYDLAIASIPISIGVFGIMLLRWKINVLSLGEKEAQSLGVNTKLVRITIILCTSIATAGAVCVSGTIGWIGLIVPHIIRMILGNDNRVLLPVTFVVGGCFLMIVDLIARTIVSTEIPIGVLTAIIGGPFFIYILKKTKGSSNW